MFGKKSPAESQKSMKDHQSQARESVISIIGPGMHVMGDCTTEGTLRVEGTVEGKVEAGKAVVVGKEGAVLGDITTQDAVIGGRVVGTIIAESRLELQATCVIEGEVRARRIKLDEGGQVNGNVQTGGESSSSGPSGRSSAPSGTERQAAQTGVGRRAISTSR